jgi:hypothetical protein
MEERKAQDEKWGEQNHHPLLWFSIIGEEYGEMCHAFNEYSFDEDPNFIDEIEREAVQVAACCVAMLECIDRMGEKGLNPGGERNCGETAPEQGINRS